MNYKYKLFRRPNVESSDEYMAEVQAALDALPDEAFWKHGQSALMALITPSRTPQKLKFWGKASDHFTVELIEHPCECRICGAKL